MSLVFINYSPATFTPTSSGAPATIIGTPEIVGDSGMLFKRYSEEELAEALYFLISDASLRRGYSCRARALVMELSWARTWNTLEAYVGA